MKMPIQLENLRDASLEIMAEYFKVDVSNAILKRFHTLGLPNKKSESYRYFPMESLLSTEYEALDFAPLEVHQKEKLEILDGQVISIPPYVRVYYAHYDDIDMEHYDPLYYLGHLLNPRVIMIEIDGDRSIELIHRFTKPNALIHYRLVIKNQANRHTTLYESFESTNAQGSLVLYGYDMVIAPDSTLRVIKNQNIQDEAYNMVSSHHYKVNRQANLVLQSFDFGNTAALDLFKVELESYATLDAGHLLYLLGKTRRGIVSQIIHKGEHSTSKQEAKSILEDDARGIFDALIRVEHSAIHAKTVQNSKAVLLGEHCYMISKPQLEIYIDELEASHGATTGQLDIKQLFYLRSRGISEKEAKKMLIIAFANTLIDHIKDARYQEKVQKSFEETFYSHTKEST